MSEKYLGQDIDIHTGGTDLKFPHHENEIVQSISHGKDQCNFVNYWFHNGILLNNNEKMSKSIGNVITIEDLKNKNIKGSAIRYALLTSHYRQPLNYTKQLIEESVLNINKFEKAINQIPTENLKEDYSLIKNSSINHLMEDINTSKYFAEMFDILKQINKDEDKKEKEIKINELFNMGHLIGLWTKKTLTENQQERNEKIPEEIIQLAEKRIEAKKNKDYALSDKIREQIKEKGYEIKDEPNSKYKITLI